MCNFCLGIRQPCFTETGNQNGIVINTSNMELDKKDFNKVRHIDCKYVKNVRSLQIVYGQ